MSRGGITRAARGLCVASLASALLAASDGRARDLPKVNVSFKFSTDRLGKQAPANAVSEIQARITDVCADHLPYWTFREAPDEVTPPRLDVSVELTEERAIGLRVTPEGTSGPQDEDAVWIQWVGPAAKDNDRTPDRKTWTRAIPETFERLLQGGKDGKRLQVMNGLAKVAPLASEVTWLPDSRAMLPYERERYPCLGTARFRIEYEQPSEGTPIRLHSLGTMAEIQPPLQREKLAGVIVRHVAWVDAGGTRHDVRNDPPPGLETALGVIVGLDFSALLGHPPDAGAEEDFFDPPQKCGPSSAGKADDTPKPYLAGG